MKVTDKEKEIIVIENIIRLLKECLEIYIKTGDYKEIFQTIRDLKKCRKEIKRLSEERIDEI